jgi:hypothetical protein
VAPERLAARLAEWVAVTPGVVRLAIDGAPAADPDTIGGRLVPLLEAVGRPVEQVRGSMFWRDASLRLEYGREDVESYLTWLDADALLREVLRPAVAAGRYLPSLRDPQTNRSTRESARPVPPGSILLVTGSLLLGRGLPFDRTIHLSLSPAALRRRTPPEDAWTLAAYEQYERTTRPLDVADLVVKLDDPRHPAVID